MAEQITDDIRARLERLFVDKSVEASRMEIFALKARSEDHPALTALFFALAEADKAQANRALLLLRGQVADTSANAREADETRRAELDDFLPAFSREATGTDYYAEQVAGQTAKAVENQRALLDRVRSHPEEAPGSYHVCAICGHVEPDQPPVNCPVCNAVGAQYARVLGAERE